MKDLATRCGAWLVGWLAILGAIAGAQTTIEVVSPTSRAGFTVPVPIRLDANQGAVGLQFDLSYDSQKLSIGEPTSGLGDLVVSSRRLAPGLRRVLIRSGDLSVLPDAILIELPATVPPGVTDDSVSLTLDAAVASDGQAVAVAPVTLLSGAVFLEDGVPVFIEVVQVDPDGTAYLSFTGVSGTQVALEFSDSLGMWQQLGVFELEEGEIVEVVDPEGLRDHAFYRARVLVP